MPIKFLPAFFLVAIALVGVGLMYHANGMPEYTDAHRASIVRQWNTSSDPHHDLGELSQKWHAEMNSLRTSKWTFHDLGRGLLVLSITVAGLIFLVRRVRGESWRTLTTPKRPLTFIVAGNVILLTIYLDFYHQLFEDLGRGMLPHWADSIAIPLGGAQSMFPTLALALSVIGYLVIRWRPLPVPLWAWDAKAPVRMWVLTPCWPLFQFCCLSQIS